MFVLSAENMRKAEETAVANGADWLTLMKTAGTKCADVISQEDKDKKIVILCGKGRNGGDGFVIAGKLWQYGFRKVFAILVYSEPTDEICVSVYDEMKKFPVEICNFTKEPETCAFHIESADVIADAVFGIGFKGELSGNAKSVVALANKNTDAVKYAIDIPSGLSADGNYNGEEYFFSDKTLTMIAYKPVHVFSPVAEMCGETMVMDIGVGDDCLSPFAEKYTVFTKNEALGNIKDRPYNSHKGTFGNVLTVCGSRNMTGCVYLCNQALVEIGAGLVTACFPDCIYDVVASKLNEPLMLPVYCNENGRMKTDAKTLYKKLDVCNVVAVGCGIGIDNDTKELVKFLIKNTKGTLILDADALNCIAKDTDILAEAECDVVITPHPGEMSRLTGKSISEIQSDRIGTATEFAKKYSVTVLLKGANTVVADKDGRVYINTTGNPSMSRGGSGDVLTGLVAGLVSQCDDVFTAVCTAAYIHGAVADELVKKYGKLSATPSRIIENIHLAF